MQPQGYLALPKSKGRGVLVLHAWWGLNDFFKDLCQRLSKEGFVTFAPDLYHGEVAKTVAEAKKLRSKMKRPLAQKQLADSLNFLCTQPLTQGDAVSVMGFSLGAYFGLGLVEQFPQRVDSVVLFYGTRGINFAEANACYLGHFAEDDDYESAQSVKKIENQIRKAGSDVAFYTYPGTTHWFFEKDRPESYNAKAAALAWKRTLEFLKA